MAVAFAAYIQGSTATAATATIDFSGRSVGDLAFALISHIAADEPDAPNGWTLLQSQTENAASWLYYKVLASGDLGTLTWTFDSSAQTMATAVVYTGAHATTPIVSSVEGTYAADGGTAVDCGSITTTTPMLVQFGSGYATSATTYTTPEGYTERVDWGSTTPDLWHVVSDTNGGWESGASAPDFTASRNCFYRQGYQVEVAAGEGPTPPASTAIMTTNRGIW